MEFIKNDLDVIRNGSKSVVRSHILLVFFGGVGGIHTTVCNEFFFTFTVGAIFVNADKLLMTLAKIDAANH